MPRYKRRESSAWKGFDSHLHQVHFLLKQSGNALYKEHFQERAKRWLDGTEPALHRVSRRALKNIAYTHPHHVAQDVMSDMRQHSKGEDVGGGVTEAIQSLGRAASNVLGVPKILEWFGHKAYDTKPIPRQTQIFAAAISETYKKVGNRALHLFGMTRLPEYDTDRISVWRQKNGEMYVSVHGTKLTGHDLAQDATILGGKTNITDSEVEAVITQLVNEGHRVDVGGHSLSTLYLTNLPMEIQLQIDEVYLFNMASSPLMDNEYLDEIANRRDNYTFFLNPSDLVSSGLYNQITDESIDDHAYIGDYRWSPLAAHGLEQWYPDLNMENMELYTPQENAEWRVHLQGMARERARAEDRERMTEQAVVGGGRTQEILGN